MFVSLSIAGRQRRNVNRIPDRLVTRTVDYISQSLFSVLYRAALRISVPQIHQLLLLAGPKSTDAFAVHFDHSEAQITLVEHYHFVLVYAVIKHMSENVESFNCYTAFPQLSFCEIQT